VCFPILPAVFRILFGGKLDLCQVTPGFLLEETSTHDKDIMEATNHDINDCTPQKNCFTTFLLCKTVKPKVFHPLFLLEHLLSATVAQAVQVVESGVAFALPVIQGATQEDLQADPEKCQEVDGSMVRINGLVSTYL